MKGINFFNKKQFTVLISFFMLIIVLFFIPTGFEKQMYLNAEGVKGRVITVDNSKVYSTGLIKQGEQKCSILIESGKDKGKTVNGVNFYSGKMEFDKVFKEGDKVFVLLERDKSENIIFANMVDHYRINKEILLVGLFVILIIAFSGYTGIRTIFSFIFALLTIWKILVPFMLKGISPILVALVIGNILTIVTLILVAGFTKKAYIAIVSSVACSFITCLLAVVFGNVLYIDGTVMQWSKSLLYAGFENLDLTAIFQGGIYLACSGAILDLSIDISVALDEIVKNSSNINRKSLIYSGLTIGKSVVGTQTTTLLLAYMGSYISVMMVYMAQGTPIMSILNSKMISAEILHTFVGCIGLVIVSPLTSIICGFVYKKH